LILCKDCVRARVSVRLARTCDLKRIEEEHFVLPYRATDHTPKRFWWKTGIAVGSVKKLWVFKKVIAIEPERIAVELVAAGLRNSV